MRGSNIYRHNTYRLDDYMREKVQRAALPLAQKSSPLDQNKPYIIQTWESRLPVPVVKPPHTVQNQGGNSYDASKTSGGQDTTESVVKPETKVNAGGGVLTQSQMTTAYTKQQMENALSNLLAMQNRKFKYDARSSPLYSIVQKQAEENARLASGRAYAQAKAATGGYGSSYATLAADEASRQAMRELDDQQLALYEAARAEFEAENASALDWYNTTKQLYEDAKAYASTGLTETASSAAQDLQTAFGTDFSEKTQREYLASKGYSEADINAALESQRKLASGTVTDYKAGTITDAVAQSQSLDEAYRQGVLTDEEYDAAKAQNSKVIMDNVNKGMVRIDDVDHTALGFSDEEWGGMNDSDKKLAVIDRVGQMVKEGVVSKSAYFQMVEKEVSLDVQEIKGGVSHDKNKDLLSVAVVVQDLYDNGYITINAYNYMMFKDILPAVNIKELQDIYRNFDEKKIMTYGDDRSAAAEVLLRHLP